MLGSCDTCHYLGLELNGELKSDDVKLTLMDGVPGLKKDATLPSFKCELKKEIAKACFLEQFGSNAITCGKGICCNGSYQKCWTGACLVNGPTPPGPELTGFPPTEPPPTAPGPTDSEPTCRAEGLAGRCFDSTTNCNLLCFPRLCQQQNMLR